MSLRRKALSGSAVLTLGEAVVYGASFVRNMILARLLTKADFGVAATFAMVITLLEFSAKLGVGRFVVRDKEGDQPDFLATAHLVHCGSALLSALIIAVAAWPLAQLFGLKDHTMAFLALAVIPAAQGFVHLDTRRFEREMRFGPTAAAEAIPQVVITLLAWPLAKYLPDFRVVLVLLIIKAVLMVGATHWFAQQRYRWQLHREYAMRMLRFGWPLLLNGFVTFFMVRGDQFIVASFCSMSDLGAYAAAASLATVPTLFFTGMFASVMLPVMAKVQDDPVTFTRRYGLIVAAISAFSAAYGACIVVGAEAMMRLVFGKQYEGAGIVLACLAAVNAIRNIRLASAIAAIAKGDSANQVISNFWGGTSLIPALALAVAEMPLWMVACSGLFGEIFACTASFRRLKQRDGLPLKCSVVPTLLVVATVSVAAMATYFTGLHQTHVLLAIACSLVAGGLAAGALVGTLPEARREAKNSFRYLGTLRGRNLFSLLKELRMRGKPQT